MSQSSSVPEHPFLSHLLGLLSVYELECDIDLKASAVIPPIPLPRYEGPRDVQTDAIECSLARIIHRMRVAEAKHDTGPDDDKPDENPLIVPPGLLSATAFESSMGAVEELRLLKAQISDVVRVCNAVAMGDLTHKITASVHGVFMEQLKGVVNTMVDNLGQFAKQVTRLGTVGTDVIFGGSTVIEDVHGTWWDLISLVRRLASEFTTTTRSIAVVASAIARGDLSRLLEFDAQGETLELKYTVNQMVIRLRAFATEATKVTFEVGSQSELGGSPMIEGIWQEITHNINRMCSDLTNQVRSITTVTTALANGDLTRRVQIEVEGEMAILKDSVNCMITQLRRFASEITRVALVGTEDIPGGQAMIEGFQGTWAELTTLLNRRAADSIIQTRMMATVITAVAKGDLSKEIVTDARGEVLSLNDSVNSMVSRLLVLANEVTRVSLEVGVLGIPGGQAVVPGVEGLWKVMTDNVNLMASNLTTHLTDSQG